MNRLYIWFTILFTIFILSLISAINLAHADTDFNKLRNSVVMVSTTTGLGSGVVIGKDRVLTAAHVVHDENTVMITFRGVDIDITGTVLKKNEDQDWAIVRVATGNVVPLPYTCNLPFYGEHVSMIGFPLGLPWLLMQGFVANDALQQDRIALDIRINHGNSGGPVFNHDGKVVGIAVAGISPEQGQGDVIGLMSPVNIFCKELK